MPTQPGLGLFRRFALPLVALLCTLGVACRARSFLHAPNIFTSDERQLNKYSAILAATEPYRQQRDEIVGRSVGKLRRAYLFLRRKDMLEYALSLRESNPAVDVAYSMYEDRMEAALASYGMQVPAFNAISEKMLQLPALKRRVLHQAAFYKVAADLDGHIRAATPQLPSLSSVGPLLSADRRPSSQFGHPTDSIVDSAYNQEIEYAGGNGGPPESFLKRALRATGLVQTQQEREGLKRFARALRDIELERDELCRDLKKKLQLDELPTNIADESTQAAYSTVIQKAVRAFPYTAARLVRSNGLETSQFDAMQCRMNKNWLFRLRVSNALAEEEKVAQRIRAETQEQRQQQQQ